MLWTRKMPIGAIKFFSEHCENLWNFVDSSTGQAAAAGGWGVAVTVVVKASPPPQPRPLAMSRDHRDLCDTRVTLVTAWQLGPWIVIFRRYLDVKVIVLIDVEEERLIEDRCKRTEIVNEENAFCFSLQLQLWFLSICQCDKYIQKTRPLIGTSSIHRHHPHHQVSASAMI